MEVQSLVPVESEGGCISSMHEFIRDELFVMVLFMFLFIQIILVSWTVLSRCEADC